MLGNKYVNQQQLWKARDFTNVDRTKGVLIKNQWGIWLVVSNMAFIFHFIYGIIPTPLMNSMIFQDGYCTTNQYINWFINPINYRIIDISPINHSDLPKWDCLTNKRWFHVQPQVIIGQHVMKVVARCWISALYGSSPEIGWWYGHNGNWLSDHGCHWVPQQPINPNVPNQPEFVRTLKAEFAAGCFDLHNLGYNLYVSQHPKYDFSEFATGVCFHHLQGGAPVRNRWVLVFVGDISN